MSKHILPGLIDPHVHLREPGQTEKEDFITSTKAAIAGGFTTIIDMPNNKVPITTRTRLEEKQQLAKKKILCDVGFYFGSQGDNLNQFPAISDKVMGLKLYLNETTGNFLISQNDVEKIFTAWKDTPILLHAEDDAVSFILSLVAKTKQKVHFCHISTEHDLALIMEAKDKNLPVSCGVTPHHLFLTEEWTKQLGPFGKMKPPLRKKSDVTFLWNHLDAIDMVESDHAPHTKAEKESAIPPFGVPGLETTVPLLLTAVSQKKLALTDVTRLCHDGPADLLGIPEDKDTYIQIDTDTSYMLEESQLYTKCKWSPFAGWKFQGKVEKVVLRGTILYENGTILVKPSFGNILTNTKK